MSESPCCPACHHGDGTFMGRFGDNTYFRCRDCGWDWYTDEIVEDYDNDEEAVSGDSWDDGQPDEAQEWRDFDPDC